MLSFFIVGFIPCDPNTLPNGMNQALLHGIVAVLGALLLALGFLFYLFILLKDTLFKRGNRQFPVLWILLSYGLLIFLGIALAYVENYKAANNIPYPGPGFLSFPFFEWMLMLGAFAFIIMFCLYVPDEVKSLREN